MFGTQKKKEYEIWKNPRNAGFSPKIGTNTSNVGNMNNSNDKDKTESSMSDFIFSKQNDLDEVFDQIYKRPAFSYDVESDPLYQQYKAQAVNQGKKAMQDTIGQAASMTGGYGNSYAVAAGNQAYQRYLENLNDIVPELYQLAHDKHSKDGQELLNKYAMLSGERDNEYAKYRDSVADEKWATELLLSGGKENEKEEEEESGEFDDIFQTITSRAQSMSTNEDLSAYLNTLMQEGVITEDERASLYSTYVIPAELPFSERKWEKGHDGGINWFGGIDNNATVVDQYNNPYRLDSLVKALVADGMSEEEAEEFILNLQDLLGI